MTTTQQTWSGNLVITNKDSKRFESPFKIRFFQFVMTPAFMTDGSDAQEVTVTYYKVPL